MIKNLTPLAEENLTLKRNLQVANKRIAKLEEQVLDIKTQNKNSIKDLKTWMNNKLEEADDRVTSLSDQLITAEKTIKNLRKTQAEKHSQSYNNQYPEPSAPAETRNYPSSNRY